MRIAGYRPGDDADCRHKDAPPEDELYAPIEWRSAGEYEDILYEKGDGIAKITINRPEVRNAFRPQTLAELRDAFDAGPRRPRGRRDRLHRRRHRGLLLRRRPADPRRRRLHRRRRGRRAGRRPPRRRRPPRPDPPPAEAGRRDGRRLRGRRRPHPAPRLRPDDRRRQRRFGQTGPRVGSFDGGFGAGAAGAPRRRQAGQGDLVPVPALRRRGGARRWGSSTRSSRSTSSSARPSPGAARCAHLSPLALRLLKASFNAAEDGLTGLQQLSHDATLLFYMTEEGQEGRNAYVEGRRPRLLEVPEAARERSG